MNAPAAASPAMPAALDGAGALCRPAPQGSLRAKLQGAIEAEFEWSAPSVPQCLGGPRPTGDGWRLLYKGTVHGRPLLVVIGVAMPPQAREGRNVPANLTVVQEGAGVFYSTQGDDKCAFDEVRLEPEAGVAGRYRLTGRGYCTQPARAIAADAGSVLLSRFDVTALLADDSGTP